MSCVEQDVDRSTLVCREGHPCLFHYEGGPADAKCPDYCSVGDCRDLIACEDACDGDGACHAHAAQWHAEQAGLVPFEAQAPRTVEHAPWCDVVSHTGACVARTAAATAVGQEVARVMQREIDALAAARLDTLVREVYAAFGWQGGTVHQVVAEVARLRRVEAAAAQAAHIVFTRFGRTDDERVAQLEEALRELRPVTGNA